MTARLLTLFGAVASLVAAAALAIPPVVAGTPARCPARSQPVHAATCGATGSVAAGFLLLFVAVALFTLSAVVKQEMGQAAGGRRRGRRRPVGNRDNE